MKPKCFAKNCKSKKKVRPYMMISPIGTKKINLCDTHAFPLLYAQVKIGMGKP